MANSVYPHHSGFKDEWLWRNFLPSELACKCCGEFFFDHNAISALQLLRDGWGKPITVNSAHRCSKHNGTVGGAPASKHLAIAFDCACPRKDQEAFAKAAKLAGFTGIIRYPARGFVHLDLRDEPYETVVS